MTVFRAYYDASGVEKEPGHLVVVGLAATDKKWGRFEARWDDVLEQYGVTYFHMKDYAHSHREYAGWKGDEPRRAAFVAALLQTIKTGMNKGYVVAVSGETIAAVNAKYRFADGRAGGSYSISANVCRRSVEGFVSRKYPGSTVHHLVEKGDAGQGDLPRLVAMSGHYAGFAIAAKVRPDGSRVREFEACDLVAWEVKRGLDQTRSGIHPPRPARATLRAIGRLLPLAGSVIEVARMMEICAKRPDLFPPRESAVKH
jgi:hypothetical protein